MDFKEFTNLDSCLPKETLYNSRDYIKIEKDRAVATNGYILVIVPIESSEEYIGLLPSELYKVYRKGGKRAIRTLYKEDGDYVVINDGVKTFSPQGVGEYPEYQSIFPEAEDEPVFEVGLNANLLMKLSKALNSEKIAIKFYGNRKAFIVKPITDEIDTGIGLMIPVRIEGNTFTKGITLEQVKEKQDERTREVA